MSGLLLDTNILIDYLRNRDEAVAYLEECDETLFISVLTIAELYAGARNKKERQAIEFFIEAFKTLPVNKEISIFGGSLRNKYGKSHNTDIIDALLAATAIEHNIQLVTLNKKHFPMLKELIVPYTYTV